MPRPEILKALNMTAAQWGQLPVDDATRQNMTQKAIDIIAGRNPPLLTANERTAAIEQSRLNAEIEGDRLTRAGFEAAMVQQSQFFGEAVAELRRKLAESEVLARDNFAQLLMRIEALEALQPKPHRDSKSGKEK